MSQHAHFVACVIPVEALLSMFEVFARVLQSDRIIRYDGVFIRHGKAGKEIAPSQCQHGGAGVWKLGKLRGRTVTKEAHPCLTLYSVEATHSYISSGLKVSK